MTRFRSERVIYEIAQITIIVENVNPESTNVGTEGIIVYAEDKVKSLTLNPSNPLMARQGREIKSHMTPTGLLFATLSLDAPPFSEFFDGLEVLTNRVDFTKLPYRRSISYEGHFNWKTMFVWPPFFLLSASPPFQFSNYIAN
jgi:hypothetical protein